MNLNYQQLTSGNPLAGLQQGELGSPGLSRESSRFRQGSSYKSTPVRALADLQKGQAVSIEIVRVVDPPVITDLRTLREEEQNTEAPITLHAYSLAVALLEFAYLVLGTSLPRTLLAPDGVGGIRMEWFRGDRNVRVVIPPQLDQNAYIYYRVAGDSHIDPFSRSAAVQTLRSVILAP